MTRREAERGTRGMRLYVVVSASGYRNTENFCEYVLTIFQWCRSAKECPFDEQEEWW